MGLKKEKHMQIYFDSFKIGTKKDYLSEYSIV